MAKARFVSKDDGARQSLEEPGAEFGFQVLYLVAYGRRRNKQAVARLAKAPVFCRNAEGPQPSQGEVITRSRHGLAHIAR